MTPGTGGVASPKLDRLYYRESPGTHITGGWFDSKGNNMPKSSHIALNSYSPRNESQHKISVIIKKILIEITNKKSCVKSHSKICHNKIFI